MSAANDIRAGIADLLAAALPGVAVVCKRDKKAEIDVAAAVEEALGGAGICVQVLPPLPTRAVQGTSFLFFEGAEVRVRVWECPQMNAGPHDAESLAEAVAEALHWSNPGGALAHPLQIAERPCEMMEDSEKRVIDVIFDAQYQINRTEE